MEMEKSDTETDKFGYVPFTPSRTFYVT